MALNGLAFTKLSEKAIIPEKATLGSAGLDLFSPIDAVVPAKNNKKIDLDLSVKLPNGVYGRIAPRSGLAINYFVGIGGGVIDADYNGNIGVIIFNFGKLDFKIKRGDRIAQLILEKHLNVTHFDVFYKNEKIHVLSKRLKLKSRDGGFGSTGK